MKQLIMGALALLATACAQAQDFDGQAIDAPRGDMLTIRLHDHQVRVHLAGIDIPEEDEPFSRRSADSLAKLCVGKRVLFFGLGEEADSLPAGRAWCGNIEAGAEQVRRGMARIDPEPVGARLPFKRLQLEARKSRRGLWSLQR
jgi:endonuclease YncB( thermonuclease family)